jgi:chemotaxis protein methyltransferase CheR
MSGPQRSSGPGEPNGDQISRLRTLVQAVSGLVIDGSRTDVLVGAMKQASGDTGCASIEEYLASLPDHPMRLQQILEMLVVGETHFARIPPQIAALAERVLPDLIERRRATGRRRLRVWSAGCSTGEEAWTLALLLRRLLPAAEGWDLAVLGTDLSRRALDAAERGRYWARSVALLPQVELARWFVPAEGGWQVCPELREIVTFRQHNLVADPLPVAAGSIDLVVCRNVIIYFDRPTTHRVVTSLHEALSPDGWLLLGPAETLWQLHDGFDTMPHQDAFAYRRRPAASEPGARAKAGRPADRRSTAVRMPIVPPVPVRTRTVLPELGATGSAGPEVGPPEVGVAQVRLALREGSYELAAQQAQELTGAQPLVAEAHYLHGLALLDLGRDAAATEALRRAVYLAPEHAFAQLGLAVVLDRQRDRGAGPAYAAAALALARLDPRSTCPELDGRPVSELLSMCEVLGTRVVAQA